MNAAELHQSGTRYGDKWALRYIDLSAPNAAVLGLVGPNGACKSTLLHLMVGLTAADEGAVNHFRRKAGQRGRALRRCVRCAGRAVAAALARQGVGADGC